MVSFPSLTGSLAADVGKLGLDLSKPVGWKPAFTDAVCGRGGESNHHPVSLFVIRSVNMRRHPPRNLVSNVLSVVYPWK